ncbi:MAG TPA: sensor histidine kinase [Candidatus Omnitrophota bacterium]|nr:sensor histidine kinase [Candidatus Omnitrophota bacterium]
MNLISFLDAISLIFVVLAILMVLANHKKHSFPFSPLLGFLALLFFNAMSNTLEWSGVTAQFDQFEDFITVVQPVMYFFFFQSFLDVRAKDDLKLALREKEVLLGEVHHRVKNNLLTLYSLVNLQQLAVKDQEEISEALQDTKQRIQAMGRAHQMLYNSKSFAEIDFAAYIKALVEEMKAAYSAEKKKIDVSLELEPVELNMETAVPCALIINEILANAFKHAFPDRNTGKIVVSLKTVRNALELKISDDGVGMPPELLFSKQKTLGLRLIHMLSEQLNGSISYKGENGSVFTIVFRNLII